MIRALLLVLMLCGCGETITYERVVNSYHVVYLDSNCITPIAPLDLIEMTYVIYDEDSIYIPLMRPYFTDVYYFGDDCTLEESEFTTFVMVHKTDMNSDYIVIDGLL